MPDRLPTLPRFIQGVVFDQVLVSTTNCDGACWVESPNPRVIVRVKREVNGLGTTHK